MNLSLEIQKDFNEQIAFLTKQKVSTNVLFHRKRAAIVGSLFFLADLADKNGLMPLFNSLIEKAKIVKGALEEQFQTVWVHNGRDVTKMNMTFLCDIAEGYNSAREHYSTFSVKLPDKMQTGSCSTSPEVKIAINKLIAKLIGE